MKNRRNRRIIGGGGSLKEELEKEIARRTKPATEAEQHKQLSEIEQIKERIRQLRLTEGTLDPQKDKDKKIAHKISLEIEELKEIYGIQEEE